MFRLPWLLLGVCIWAVLPDRVSSAYKGSVSMTEDPDEKEFLLIEFRSNDPEHIVKKYFDNVTVTYGFKVYGAPLYKIVIENKQDEALKSLTMPKEVRKNVTAKPVETMKKFLARRDILINSTKLENFTDRNLTFVKGVWKATGMNQETYNASVAHYVRIRGTFVDLSDIKVVFMHVGNLPTEFVCFWETSDLEAAENIPKKLDVLGGRSHMIVDVLKIYNI